MIFDEKKRPIYCQIYVVSSRRVGCNKVSFIWFFARIRNCDIVNHVWYLLEGSQETQSNKLIKVKANANHMKGCVRLAAAGTIVGRSRKQRGRSALRHPGCACALVLLCFCAFSLVCLYLCLGVLYSLFQFWPSLYHRDYAWGHKVFFYSLCPSSSSVLPK